MVALAPGLVVLVRFPFSDLSSSKLRPAIVLANAGGVDWVLCLVIREAGALLPAAHRTIVQSVIALLRSGLQ